RSFSARLDRRLEWRSSPRAGRRRGWCILRFWRRCGVLRRRWLGLGWWRHRFWRRRGVLRRRCLGFWRRRDLSLRLWNCLVIFARRSLVLRRWRGFTIRLRRLGKDSLDDLFARQLGHYRSAWLDNVRRVLDDVRRIELLRQLLENLVRL